MGRLLQILLFILLAGYGIYFLAGYNQHRAETYTPQTATVLDAVAAAAVDTTTDFSASGTLVFYPNNVGPVPYLFYTDAKGNTVAKALVFPIASSVEGSWSGSHISVTGHLSGEHVVVSGIEYVSPP